MKNLLDKPVNEVKFIINNNKSLKLLSEKLIKNDGKSNIKIEFNDLNKKFTFKLKNRRQIDRKSINLIKNKDISAIIN